ncbi:LuxR C-terminal-related transcriptional regulator [Streptomyces sp. NPDC058457]|uniref:helix-turn-helix transcriptional regulator n=1 Tax=Streptomyces sp. NPDC058457 TaxID=3346507 RepID=UPI00365B1D72
MLPPIAVLAPRLDVADAALALDHGVASYLLEPQCPDLFTVALHYTSRGGSILASPVAADWVRARSVRGTRVTAGPEPDLARRLTRRERQVVELLTTGLGVREIAGAMFLTEKTVRNYLSRVYPKLGVQCRSDAILRWLGRLEPDTPDAGPP